MGSSRTANMLGCNVVRTVSETSAHNPLSATTMMLFTSPMAGRVVSAHAPAASTSSGRVFRSKVIARQEVA